jgi:hypothetical protein
MAEPRESVASWLGINRATLAVLVVIGGLGLSEEIWSNFFGIQLKKIFSTGLKDVGQEAVLAAAFYVALKGFCVNFLEGIGYIVGGTLAHKLGARIALAASAAPLLIVSVPRTASEH